MLFIVVFLIEGAVPAIRPDGYSPLRHPISTFAIGEFGWIQVANFLVTGALLVAFAMGVRRAGGGIWAPVLIGLVGVGLIGAGVFTADPLSGYPPGTPAMPAMGTTHGVLHEAFSAPVFLGLPAAAGLVGYRFAKSGHRWWAGYSVGTAVAFLALFVLTSMGFAQTPAFVAVGGLLQRLTITVGFSWLTVLALHLIRRESAASSKRVRWRRADGFAL
jgi:hypothetical protein